MKEMSDNTSALSRGRHFYRIIKNENGQYDIWLSPGEPVLMTTENGLMDYNLRILAVTGVEWPGTEYELEEDIRRRYDAWISGAEIIEI